MASILVIDDELSMREFLCLFLQKEGHQVFSCPNGRDGLVRLNQEEIDLVITDLKMPGMSGLHVLEEVKKHDPSIQVMVMTAFGSTETAVQAMKDGAVDYVTKPFKLDQLRVRLDKALQVRELKRENLYLKERLEGQSGLARLVGKSAAMRQVYDLILRLARSRTTVLVSGESGTGKELVAKAIHDLSDQAQSPFVAVNCAAIPSNLIESELFGHLKGAFTGATRDTIGLFESAKDGTLFLDEIGELPLDLQVKLLRVLQERKVKRIGSTQERPLYCRIITASNKDLQQAVREGAFREDLYYRLNVVQVHVPPLRERPDDIPLLVEHFLAKYRDETPNPVKGLTKPALQQLMSGTYEGNIRQLENTILRAMALTNSDMIDLDSLPQPSQRDTLPSSITPTTIPEQGLDLDQIIDQVEKEYLLVALEKANGVRKQAAKLLGITFRSMRYRLQKHGVDRDTLRDD